MKVNKNIKNMLKEISERSVEYANDPNNERKYIRRILKLYTDVLTEDERIYVFKSLMEDLRYKNLATDPDNLIMMHNIKMRSWFTASFIIVVLISLTMYMYSGSGPLAKLIETVNSSLTLFSLTRGGS